jgi:hypothetical protein
MNLSNAMALRSEGRQIQAGAMPKADAKYTPVHAGAHDHLTKIGYMHTGNKTRGGITTSNYFKAKMGNSRNVAVQKDGSYIKTSKTAKGTRRSRGKLDACGLKMKASVTVDAGGPGSGRHAGGSSGPKANYNGNQKALDIMHKGMVSSGYTYNRSSPSETVEGAHFHDYKGKDGMTSAGIREHSDGKLEFLSK